MLVNIYIFKPYIAKISQIQQFWHSDEYLGFHTAFYDAIICMRTYMTLQYLLRLWSKMLGDTRFDNQIIITTTIQPPYVMS